MALDRGGPIIARAPRILETVAGAARLAAPAPLAQEGELAPEFVRRPGIVRVEKGAIVAPGGADARIARRRRPTIVTMTQGPEPGLPAGLAEVGGPVRGAIVDDDDLVVDKGLRTDAVQGLTDGVCAVVGRDDDRDRRDWARLDSGGQDERPSQW